jgi:hypothetical protein
VSWSSFSRITSTEILTWFAFWVLGPILGGLGAHFVTTRVSELLGLVLWVGLFLAIYKLRYKRL